MTNLFTRSLAYHGTITAEVDGFTLTARVEHDDSAGAPWAGAPWDRFGGDCHGPVSDWTSRPKAPGERVLKEERDSYRYYDYAEAMKIAKRDGWDAEPYGGTKGERAKRAIEADFKRLKAWANDEWNYVTVVVGVSRKGITLDDYAASLSGIESDAGEHLTETANELAGEALERGKALLAQLIAAD